MNRIQECVSEMDQRQRENNFQILGGTETQSSLFTSTHFFSCEPLVNIHLRLDIKHWYLTLGDLTISKKSYEIAVSINTSGAVTKILRVTCFIKK